MTAQSSAPAAIRRGISVKARGGGVPLLLRREADLVCPLSGTMSADAISAVWHQHQIIEQHPRQYSSLLSIRGLTQERTSPLHRRFLSFDETTSPAEAALFDNGRRASTPGSSTAPPSASVMYDSPLYESFTRHDRLGSDASVVSLPPTPYESPLFGTPNQSRRSSLEASFLTEVDVCKPSGSCLLQPTASEDAEEDDSPTPTVLADNDRFESAFDERLESPSDSGTRQVLGTSTATNQVLSRPTSPEDEGSRRLRRAKTIASLSGDRKSSIKVNTAVPPVPAGMRVGSPRPTDCAFIPLHRI